MSLIVTSSWNFYTKNLVTNIWVVTYRGCKDEDPLWKSWVARAYFKINKEKEIKYFSSKFLWKTLTFAEWKIKKWALVFNSFHSTIFIRNGVLLRWKWTFFQFLKSFWAIDGRESISKQPYDVDFVIQLIVQFQPSKNT